MISLDHEKALAFAKTNSYDGAEYVGVCEGFFCYAPFFNYLPDEEVPPIGLPALILMDQNEGMRFSTPEQSFRIMDKLKNQLEGNFTARFGGRLSCAMPDGRCIYHYRGRDYLLESAVADSEAVMRDSLERGKNLLITTFPVVDLYPDPNCDY